MDAVVHVPDPAAGSFRGADNLRFEVPCDVNGGGVVAVPPHRGVQRGRLLLVSRRAGGGVGGG